MKDTIRQALAEARRRLEACYGDRLVRLVLYGSQARGDARSESDVDVLVVLDGPFELYAEAKTLARLAMDLFDRYGQAFSFQPFTEADFYNPASSFMRNVRTEGVEV